jgi:hypothetical protein
VGRTQVPEIRVSRARARAAQVSAAGTCSCSARQRPAHHNGPALSELSTVARTLERKIPVLRSSVASVAGGSKVPQIRQRPHANCASHACPFRCCKQALRIHVFTGGAGSPRHTHGTHTRAHTGTRMHGSHRRTSQPSQPTNATPTHPHARRPKPPTAAALIQEKPPCWCRKFRCSDMLAAMLAR